MGKKLSLFLLLISAGLLTALAAGPVFGGNHGLDKAKEAQERHTDTCWPRTAWWALPWAWMRTATL